MTATPATHSPWIKITPRRGGPAIAIHESDVLATDIDTKGRTRITLRLATGYAELRAAIRYARKTGQVGYTKRAS